MKGPQAVIIGSGLSGLLISRALAAARVDHLLLGGPPDSAPRLGESLSLEASVFAFDFLGEFLPHFLSKQAVVGFVGEQVLACDLRIDRARLFFRLLGYQSPSALFHVDRIGLDAALYQSVVANSFCEQRNARVIDLRYDPGSDRVVEIHLDDGACLRPGVVFDATNHVRLVAKAVGVPCRMLSGLQRVVHTHYRPLTAQVAADVNAWELCTSIVRLEADIDGVEGIAWCIPVKDCVSIGITLESSASDTGNEALAGLAEEAFRRRGLVFRERYPEATSPRGLRHYYFVHERGYGANWLLVGPSYGQIWWMSGTGVASAMAAARVAARFVRSPQAAGPVYETFMTDLLPSHSVLDWFVVASRTQLNHKTVSDQADRLIRANTRRLARLTLLGRNPICSGFAGLLHRCCARESFLHGYCTVKTRPLAEQSRAIFAEVALRGRAS
jgi:flavin-dependent dehydrogenase